METIKYGFLIKNGKIYDTKIPVYKLSKMVVDENIIYYAKPNSYKRLVYFEVLLLIFNKDKVFDILNYNKYLKKQRVKEENRKSDNLHYISNFTVIYNYPPKYLTRKHFLTYKKCQALKKRLV